MGDLIPTTDQKGSSFCTSVLDCIGQTPVIKLGRLFPESGVQVFAKCEFMNPGGSMKDRTARFMIEEAFREGCLKEGDHLVESSSGNLGVAIAMQAPLYGLNFTCVVDPKTAPANLKILHALGAQVDMVKEPDECGGYLHTRVRRVRQWLERDPKAFWLNQYANENNWKAHYCGTGLEMMEQLPEIDVLVGAVSTTGSLLGTSRRLRERFPHLLVVAVDAQGSVIFGGIPKDRNIPGIGSSRVPEICVHEEVDQVIYVDDNESIQGCQRLVETEGIMAGGSSGSVVSGIKKLLHELPRPIRIGTILPDRGDRYLDLVYEKMADRKGMESEWNI